MSAPTQFAYRTQKNIGIVNAASSYEAPSAFERPEGTPFRCSCYSPDGHWYAWAEVERVKIIDCTSGSVKSILPVHNVYDLAFSTKGIWINSWERPSKQEDGNAAKNLKIWRTETGELVQSFVQKSQVSWNLQYTPDEKYCARIVTNTVQFFISEQMDTVWNSLRVEGVTEFALSGGRNCSVAVFVPERKGQPATVRTFTLPDFNNHVSQKSFYKADKVQLKWNELGTRLLVLTQTEVDKTGKSYYGETNLYLMSAAGDFDCRIHLDKEGPIHDVAWKPDSREFGVVYGYMPAKTTIFDARANVVHSLPLGPRNTILYSPHGRFVIVAGFGNLQGQMDVIDCEKNYTKIATIEASNASVCEWSPDGRHILTATTSPRLRVDNGVKIWYYTGPLMYHEELAELYQVAWRPAPPSAHPLPTPLPDTPQPHKSAASHVATNAPSKPVGAYRPPHARGTATPIGYKREDEGGTAQVSNGVSVANGLNGVGKGRRREVPGAAPAEKLVPGAAPGGGVSLAGTGVGADEGQLSKSALRNKKKRDAKKAKAEAEAQESPRQPVANGNDAASAAANSDGKPIPAGSSSERQGRDGHQQHHRGQHRSRSRHGTDSPHRGHQHRRSKSRNQERDREGQHGNGKPQPNRNSNNLTIPTGPANLTVSLPIGTSSTPLSPIPATPTTEDKKLRGLYKKLRAIEDLKMRLAAGEKLEDTQLKKIATEDGVRKELELLEGSGGA